MGTPGSSQERCPSCGSNEIKVDRRYGSKLKGREVAQQVFRKPLYWLLFALVVLPGYLVGPDAPAQVAWRCILPALSLVLIIILILRVYRQVSHAGTAGQFPAALATCLRCRHTWDSDGA